MANELKMVGLGKLIAAMTAFGLVVGLMFGLLGSTGLLPPGAIPVLIGVFCGVAAPLLIWRLRPVQ